MVQQLIATASLGGIFLLNVDFRWNIVSAKLTPRFSTEALTERQRYWLEQIQSCEASGKTIAEYSQDQGIVAKAMYAGKKALVKKGVLPRTRPTRFQRAQVVGPAVGSEWHIQLPNGVSVTFSCTVDAGALTTVLNTVATLE